MPDAGEHVVERAAVGLGEADAVGGDDRQMKRGGEIAQRLVVGFLVAQEVPLQLDGDVRRAEDADQPIDQAADAEPPAVDRRSADQRDQPADLAIEILERERAFPFRRAELHARDAAGRDSCSPRREPTSTGSVSSRGDPPPARRSGRLPTRQLGADDRLDPRPLRREMKPRQPIDAIAIEQRQRRIPEGRRALDERLGQRRAVEKGERR